MKRTILILILVFVTAGLLTGCPHRPRHGGIPKPRMPYVEPQAAVQNGDIEKKIERDTFQNARY